MNVQRMWQTIMAGVGLAAVLTFAPGVRGEEDRDENYYRNALEAMGAKIGTWDREDKERSAADHLEILRGLVTEGRTKVANEQLDDLEAIMTRVEARARFVDAMLRRLDLEKRVKTAEQQATEAEQKAKTTEKSATDLENRYKQFAGRGL